MNDLAVIEANEIAPSATPSSVFCSYKTDDFVSKMRLAATISETENIANHLGETIMLTHFIVQSVEMDDEKRVGEKVWAQRTILLDDKGQGYSAISSVMVQRLWTLIGILGEPSTWPEPVPVVVTKEKGAKFSFFDLKVVI